MKVEEFTLLANAAEGMSQKEEQWTMSLSAEESDFVRFNHAKIRQPGSVTQQSLSIRLIHGGKHVTSKINLSGDIHTDTKQMQQVFVQLRELLAVVPVDPHFLINTEVSSSVQIDEPSERSVFSLVDEIVDKSAGLDMVGILANGSISKGFANSYGQRNWFQTHNFNFDWSFVETTDKAVKTSYAGQKWDSAEFQVVVDSAKRKLEALRLPPITLQPGEYRVALSPSALWELFEVVAWGGFGLRNQQTKVSSLLKLVDGEESLHSMITLRENIKAGASPNFQGDGFISPETITLIEQGRHCNSLISPRSAKEYEQTTNGANGSEMPHSLDLDGGNIARADLLSHLHTGIDISNLWYLNYSDRVNCGITGMTRFATLWVENGEIKGPINPMRFDDTIYRLLGTNLLGLTQERSFLLSAGSYFERSTGCAILPCALIDNMRFTL